MPSIMIAAIAASASGLGPGPAKAITGVEAVYTGADGWLSNPGTLGMPSTSRYLCLSYWWNSTNINSISPVFCIGNSVAQRPGSNGTISVLISHDSGFDGVSEFAIPSVLVRTGYPDENGVDVSYFPADFNNFASYTHLPYDGEWHWNFLFIDSVAPQITWLVDGQSLTGYTTIKEGPGGIGTGIPTAMTLSGSSINLFTIGRFPGPLSTNPSIALVDTGLAELMVFADQQIDITDSVVQAGFIRPSGDPVRNGMSGATVFGEDVQPQIYLHNDASIFNKNYKDGGWDTLGNYTDPGSNSFTVNGTTLVTATTDPWGGEASGF